MPKWKCGISNKYDQEQPDCTESFWKRESESNTIAHLPCHKMPLYLQTLLIKRGIWFRQSQLQAPEVILDPLLSCSFIRGRVQSGIVNDTLRECGGSLLLCYNCENFLVYIEHHITQIGSDYSRVYRMCLVLHDNKTSADKLNEYKP